MTRSPTWTPFRSAVLPGLCLVLLAAAVVRSGSLIAPRLVDDELWVGVEALNVLTGVFPPFIYGTPYQGSLGLLLHALSIAVAGATPWALKIVPMLYSLLSVVLTFLLAGRLFDRETAWVAALVAACPGSPLLTEILSAQYYYSLIPVLGTLVLLVGLSAWQHQGRARAARWFVFGLLSGMAFWTNYSGVIYPVAIGIPLIATDFRRALEDGLRYVLPGYLLGTLPLWLYNLQARVVFVFPAGPLWDDWRSYLPHLPAYFRQVFEKMGVVPPGDPRWTALAGLHALLVASVFLAGLAATVARARRGAVTAVIPLVVAAHMAPIVASRFGGDIPIRYLMPVLTAIPLVFGAAFVLMRRWSRPLAWGLMAVLVAVNLGASGSGLATVPVELHRVLADWTTDRRLVQHLTGLGLRAVYADRWGLGFTGGGTVTVSRSWQDWNIIGAEAVDSSAGVAFVHDGPFVDLESGLTALNARYRVDRVGRWWVYREMTLPAIAYAEILPDSWSAWADDNPEQASVAFDRDVETAWTGQQKSWRRYTLDLGLPETVAMIAWIPRVYHESPSGIEVNVSLDGDTWNTVASVPKYGIPVYWSGTHPFRRLRRSRVEVRFQATRARFIRLGPLQENTRFDWSMREIFIYRPAGGDVAPDPVSLDQVGAVLARRRVREIYGDHWVLARLHAVSKGALPVLPVNIFIDLHGRSDLYPGLLLDPESPQTRAASDGRPAYEHPDPFRLRRQTVVVLQRSSGTTRAFEGLLRESGYTFQTETLGDYAIYSGFVATSLPQHPLPATGWAAWAAPAGETARHAIDGRPGSRWSTDRPQRPGDWFAVDLGRGERIGAIELDTHDAASEAGRRLELVVSADGVHWVQPEARIIRLGRLAWGGTHALRRGISATWLTFPAVTARFLTLHQTAHSAKPWTIEKLRIYPAPE